MSKPPLNSNKKFSKMGIGVLAGTAGIIFDKSFSSTLLLTLNSINYSPIKAQKNTKKGRE
jgi:hypothetical protein